MKLYVPVGKEGYRQVKQWQKYGYMVEYEPPKALGRSLVDFVLDKLLVEPIRNFVEYLFPNRSGQMKLPEE